MLYRLTVCFILLLLGVPAVQSQEATVLEMGKFEFRLDSVHIISIQNGRPVMGDDYVLLLGGVRSQDGACRQLDDDPVRVDNGRRTLFIGMSSAMDDIRDEISRDYPGPFFPCVRGSFRNIYMLFPMRRPIEDMLRVRYRGQFIADIELNDPETRDLPIVGNDPSVTTYSFDVSTRFPDELRIDGTSTYDLGTLRFTVNQVVIVLSGAENSTRTLHLFGQLENPGGLSACLETNRLGLRNEISTYFPPSSVMRSVSRSWGGTSSSTRMCVDPLSARWVVIPIELPRSLGVFEMLYDDTPVTYWDVRGSANVIIEDLTLAYGELVVEDVDFEIEEVVLREFSVPLPNCAGTDVLEIEEERTITRERQIEVTTSESSQREFELIPAFYSYQGISSETFTNMVSGRITETQSIRLTAAPGSHVVYEIGWIVEQYSGNLSARAGGEEFTADFRFDDAIRLRLLDSRPVSCD